MMMHGSLSATSLTPLDTCASSETLSAAPQNPEEPPPNLVEGATWFATRASSLGFPAIESPSSMNLVRSALKKLSSSWHRALRSTTHLQILSNSAALSSKSQCTANPYFTHHDYSRGFYYVRRSVPLGSYSKSTQEKDSGLAMTCATGFTSAVHSKKSAFETFHGQLQHRDTVSPPKSSR